MAYAALPFIVARLARAAAIAPFDQVAGHGWRAGRFGQAAALGAIIAAASSFAPAVLPMTLVCAVALALGSLLTGQPVHAGRLAGETAKAVGIAVLLCAPWAVGVLLAGGHSVAIFGLPISAAAAPGWGEVTRFAIGPTVRSPIAWALVAGSALPLLLGKGIRLVWAARLWAMACASWVLAFAATHGWTGSFTPSESVVLVPAAIAVAAGVGLGVSTFENDLAGLAFGWRQIVSGFALVAVVVGVLPVVAGSVGGRWGLPPTGSSNRCPFSTAGPRRAPTARSGWGTRAPCRPAAGRCSPGWRSRSRAGAPRLGRRVDARRSRPGGARVACAAVGDDRRDDPPGATAGAARRAVRRGRRRPLAFSNGTDRIGRCPAAGRDSAGAAQSGRPADRPRDVRGPGLQELRGGSAHGRTRSALEGHDGDVVAGPPGHCRLAPGSQRGGRPPRGDRHARRGHRLFGLRARRGLLLDPGRTARGAPACLRVGGAVSGRIRRRGDLLVDAVPLRPPGRPRSRCWPGPSWPRPCGGGHSRRAGRGGRTNRETGPRRPAQVAGPRRGRGGARRRGHRGALAGEERAGRPAAWRRPPWSAPPARSRPPGTAPGSPPRPGSWPRARSSSPIPARGP